MRGLGIRILKSAVPAALVLAGLGYLFAEMAGTWYEVNNPARAGGSDTVAKSLRQKLPFAMAAWGFGLIAVYELLRSLWMPTPTPRANPVVAEPTVEDQLQQLLRGMEAGGPTATPPPVDPVSLPVSHDAMA